ncbi:MAG TPA: glycosyltransferase family 39 protein [Bacteroidia bacterium]|jgi:4-amino-4-deoxy-L-arabinose transferase-like glycosyltransferase|nr:glycosyltransferase family 39 protein [Bacteroidia bacterium]
MQDTESLILPTGIIFLGISILFHVFNRKKTSLAFLICAAFFLFLYASRLYPFLNVWDERFHALVAKNLMKHPLMPTLYDEPVVNMAYDDGWGSYHVWLHKQPLFMWQIALSYKIFGVNEFALRFPSVLLCCVMVYAGYRSGEILGNKNTAYYTGLLIATSAYLMKLVSGVAQLDQNDTSFVVYVSLSIWAWLEYRHTNKKGWFFLIGIFSGFAILCKWLVGLLVYLIWGIYSLQENKFQFKKYKNILLAVLVTVLVALPWQIFTLIQYSAEARNALVLNGKHFTEAVDGQGGDFFYHFRLIGTLFGNLFPYLIIPAFIVFYFKTSNKKTCISFFISIIAVYLFFSFAATKMSSFPIVVMLPMFLAMAFLFDFIFAFLMKKAGPSEHINIKILLLVVLLTISFIRTDCRSLYTYHKFSDLDDGYAKWALSHNKKVFQNLNLPKTAVLFNVKHYVDAMYYTGLPAYKFVPSKEQYDDLCSKKRVIVIFKHGQPEETDIPGYLTGDKRVILLNDTIIPCE